jgi:hypothetical protein
MAMFFDDDECNHKNDGGEGEVDEDCDADVWIMMMTMVAMTVMKILRLRRLPTSLVSGQTSTATAPCSLAPLYTGYSPCL